MNTKPKYRSYQEQNRWISRQRHDYPRGNRWININYHRNREDRQRAQHTFQSNSNSYHSRTYTSHYRNNHRSRAKRRNYYQNTNNRNRNYTSYNYHSNYNYNYNNNVNSNNYRYNYNYNYNYNHNNPNNFDSGRNINRYYTRQGQYRYPYRRDNYDSRNTYNQRIRRFRNNNKLNKRRSSNNVNKSSKLPKAATTASSNVKRTVVVGRRRKSKYRKVSPIVSMVKQGKKNVLIPIRDDNSNGYKILLHNDYLQLICMFLNLNELLTKFVLLSKFYYVFIKSNDSSGDGYGTYVSRKIFDTCLNNTFPNFLNDTGINGNKFKTNILYEKNICKMLTNWNYFLQHQRQLRYVSHYQKAYWRNVDLCNLLSCCNSSIIIYWLKRVSVMNQVQVQL